jgi:hypothetical protein
MFLEPGSTLSSSKATSTHPAAPESQAPGGPLFDLFASSWEEYSDGGDGKVGSHLHSGTDCAMGHSIHTPPTVDGPPQHSDTGAQVVAAPPWGHCPA